MQSEVTRCVIVMLTFHTKWKWNDIFFKNEHGLILNALLARNGALIDVFIESKRTFVLEKNPSIKIFHVKCLRRMNDVLSAITSDSVILHNAYKTIERWHYCAGKVNALPRN